MSWCVALILAQGVWTDPEKADDFTFAAAAHQMRWAFRENHQRYWHVEPAYTGSIYSEVISRDIVVRATETSFGIGVSRDGPPP